MWKIYVPAIAVLLLLTVGVFLYMGRGGIGKEPSTALLEEFTDEASPEDEASLSEESLLAYEDESVDEALGPSGAPEEGGPKVGPPAPGPATTPAPAGVLDAKVFTAATNDFVDEASPEDDGTLTEESLAAYEEEAPAL